MRDNDFMNCFDEYGTDTLCIADFGLTSQGCLLTHITRNADDTIDFWAGDPNTNDSEKIVLDAETKSLYLDMIERGI